MRALAVAVQLNEVPLIAKVYEACKLEDIPSLCANFPKSLLPRFLAFIAGQMEASVHCQYHLTWAVHLLQQNASWLRAHRAAILESLRQVQVGGTGHAGGRSHAVCYRGRCLRALPIWQRCRRWGADADRDAAAEPTRMFLA